MITFCKNAHWTNNDNGTVSCSHCHTWFYKDDRYSYMRCCPYCGAKMESEEEEWQKEDERWEVISILSEIRSKYDCFNEKEQPYYHALSVAIKSLRLEESGNKYADSN